MNGIATSLFMLAGIFVPSFAFAQADVNYVTPNLSIPDLDIQFTDPVRQGDILHVNFIGEYIAQIFPVLIGFAVTAAIVMLMIGGVQYMIGGGVPAQIQKAKVRMTSAIIGLVLLLSTVMILEIINPETTVFRPESLQIIQGVPVDGQAQETGVNPDGGADIAIPPSSAGTGNVPLLKQGGATEWGPQKYGNLPKCPGGEDPGGENPGCCSSYGYAGCAPTSVAMILQSYGYDVKPNDVGDFAVQIGARVCNDGTNNQLPRRISEGFAGTTSRLIRGVGDMQTLLRNGFPLLTSTPVVPGCHTRGGHWIVLTGMSGNSVSVNDSASGRCFEGRDSSDGFVGAKGPGMTSMNAGHLEDIPVAWLITTVDRMEEAEALLE